MLRRAIAKSRRPARASAEPGDLRREVPLARSGAAALLAALAVLACAPERRAQEPNPLERPPIDSLRAGSPDEVAGWRYREESTADLDGDGAAETVVLASEVEMGTDGQPLWEDGHRWALLVES